ncbi:MAG: tRNA-dihydrouridine synthase, partial [Deltaproteobacteria bacterium]|nr:tRNA-dihydrouridine synthase [Deltaproteobacteria bacterium]
SYFDLGVDKIILGTAAYKNPDLVTAACRRFPERILLGIDANDGFVSVEGWTEKVNMTAIEMARNFERIGISAIIYTDILRDGMQTGPNLETTKQLAEAIHTPIIASGGISDIHDIAALLQLSDFGVIGLITGRALYEGTLDLTEAINLGKKG